MPKIEILEPGFRRAIEKIADMYEFVFEQAFDIYIKYVLYKGTKHEQTQLVRNIGKPLTP